MSARPRRRYRVYHVPGMSDTAGTGYFAVWGPRVNEFAECARLASVMQVALNHQDRTLTPRQWKVIRAALHMALAGVWSEGDLCWTQTDADAAQAALDVL